MSHIVCAPVNVQNWIAPPAPRPKFYSSQDAVHLEDESGRVKLTGDVIKRERDREGGGFVTGVIMGVLGFENSSGDFEVMELCFAGMPDVYHPSSSGTANGKGKAKESMDVDDGECTMLSMTNVLVKPEGKTWVALVSGLSVGNETSAPDLKSELLVEWLMGENGGAQVCETRRPGADEAGPAGRITDSSRDLCWQHAGCTGQGTG